MTESFENHFENFDLRDVPERALKCARLVIGVNLALAGVYGARLVVDEGNPRHGRGIFGPEADMEEKIREIRGSEDRVLVPSSPELRMHRGVYLRRMDEELVNRFGPASQN